MDKGAFEKPKKLTVMEMMGSYTPLMTVNWEFWPLTWKGSSDTETQPSPVLLAPFTSFQLPWPASHHPHLRLNCRTAGSSCVLSPCKHTGELGSNTYLSSFPWRCSTSYVQQLHESF